MRKELQTILILFTLLGSVCLISVVLLTLPAFTPLFDLSKTGIGDTIGGITSPILGLITTILLYLTLNKQIQSMEHQELKSEIDVIFLLLNQLENEYNMFLYNENEGGIKTKLYGYEGLMGLVENKYNFHIIHDPRKFFEYNWSKQIILLVRSYLLIKERVEMSTLKTDIKLMFNRRIHTFYECKLQKPLETFEMIFDKYPDLRDEYSDEVLRLVNHEKLITYQI